MSSQITSSSIVVLGTFVRTHGVPGRKNQYAYKCELFGRGASQWAHLNKLHIRCSAKSHAPWESVDIVEVKALSSSLEKAHFVVITLNQPLENFVGCEFGVARNEFPILDLGAGDVYLCDLENAEVWDLNKSKSIGRVIGSYCVSDTLEGTSHNLRIKPHKGGDFEVPLAWVDMERSEIRPYGGVPSILEIPGVEQWMNLKADA